MVHEMDKEHKDLMNQSGNLARENNQLRKVLQGDLNVTIPKELQNKQEEKEERKEKQGGKRKDRRQKGDDQQKQKQFRDKSKGG